ncbi:hypothetical protein VTP01DRAFT_10135 [Rhizomucor pusillus]|uniref:uncharacterized protein n=1 Tax=Rhizomucor pusillus TaxID=4840 RepID=UPI0037429DB3
MSQSQSSQRGGKRAIEEESDDDYGEGPSTQRIKVDEASSQSQNVDWDSEALSRKVKDTVRYALACEYKRVPIRREDINKKILHERTREFKTVYQKAQEKLKYLFGMEMSELPSREKGGLKVNLSKTDGPKAQSTNSYVLINKLDAKYKVHEILPHSEEEYQQTGLLYVILALIFVHEKTITDVDLKQNLDRLRVTDETETFGDREKLLEYYVKQGYLHRAKAGEDPNSDVVYQYYWGPRAKIEVADTDITDFIISLYDVEPDEDKQLREYIFKAAGYASKD